MHLGLDRLRVRRVPLPDRRRTVPDGPGEVESDRIVVDRAAYPHVHPDDSGKREEDEHGIAPCASEPVSRETRPRARLAKTERPFRRDRLASWLGHRSVCMSSHSHESRSRALRARAAVTSIGTI